MATVKAAATQQAVDQPPVKTPRPPATTEEEPSEVPAVIPTKSWSDQMDELRATMNKYEEPYRYTAYYPKTWKVSQSGGWKEFCNDSSKAACLGIQVTKNDYADNGAFHEGTYGLFKQTVGNYHLISEEEGYYQNGGNPGWFYEHSYSFQGHYKGFAAYVFSTDHRDYARIYYQIYALINEDEPLVGKASMYSLLRNLIYLLETHTSY
jgi:hypothetical protein